MIERSLTKTRHFCTKGTRRQFVFGCSAALWSVIVRPVQAEGVQTLAATQGATEGRPSFQIRALTLPKGLENAHAIEQELSRYLKREAKRNDWGGGRKNEIQARFDLRALTFQTSGATIHVSATLVGQLPGGRRAESTVSFGGATHQRGELTRQVLSIVATGVMTRLADMERKRRGL